MNEAQNRQNTSGDSVTFDYNQLYANTVQTTIPVPEAIPEVQANPVMQETPIVFEEEKQAQPEIVTNFIPTFDTKVLEGVEENNMNTHEELISSIKSDKQQEDEQYKKNIIFILAFFGVLIFAVVFLFPLLAGY